MESPRSKYAVSSLHGVAMSPRAWHAGDARAAHLNMSPRLPPVASPRHIPKEHADFLAGVGIAATCAKSRQSINIESAYDDPRFNRAVDDVSGYTTRSILAMPFESCSSGELMGVCQLLNKVPRSDGAHFDGDDEEILGSVLKLAALAIENNQLCRDYLLLVKQMEG